MKDVRDATPFHSFEWMQLLKAASPSETPFYWGIWVKSRLSAIWPSVLMQAFGGPVLYSLPHSNFGAPAVIDGLDVQVLWKLAARVVGIARKLEVLHWTVDGLTEPLGGARQCGFEAQASHSCTFLLDMRVGKQVLWNKLHSEARTAVRKAQKFGLSFGLTERVDDLYEYFSIYKSTMARRQRRGLGWSFFESLHSLLGDQGRSKLFVVRYGGEIVAGMIILLQGSSAFWWSGASKTSSWGKRPNEFALWNIIEWAVDHGITDLDLGPTPADEASGLNLFKRHFGGERIELMRLKAPVMKVRDFLISSLVSGYRKLDKYGFIPDHVADHFHGSKWFD